MRDLKAKIIRGEKRKMRKLMMVLSMTALLIMGTAAMAFANHATDTINNYGGSSDPTAANYNPNEDVDNWGDRTTTATGGAGVYSNCTLCHGSTSNKGDRGPHGGYTATTRQCTTCHTVHAATNATLLPGNTVTAVCNYCHDLTGTAQGPYNMLGVTSLNTKNTGAAVKVAAHRVVGLKVYTATSANLGDWSAIADITSIPGGDNTNGGPATLNAGAGLVNRSQGGLSGTVFTCDSCHTPHAVPGSTVKSYLGDSHVKNRASDLYSGSATNTYTGLEGITYNLTSRLLKRTPNGVTSQVYDTYGSGWCAACHQGRDNDSMSTFNHPVDENAKGYIYLDQNVTLFNNALDKGGLAAATVADLLDDLQADIDKGNTVTLKGIGIKDAARAEAQGYAVGGVLVDGLADDTFKTGRYSSATSTFANWSSWTGAQLRGDVRSMWPYAMTDSDATNNSAARTAGQYRLLSNYPNGPSCQQCHASDRNVEGLFNEESNPANMNFPHVSKNDALLVEYGDDFCTNCHGLDNLP